MEYGRVTDRELESIRKMVGPERMSTGESVLALHSKDESFHPRREPDVVVWPLRTEEISQILKMANEKRIPVTPWGAGTSLEGNPIPVEGGDCFRSSTDEPYLGVQGRGPSGPC